MIKLHEWEVVARVTIATVEFERTKRMRVPGGWLYRHSHDDSRFQDTMCFVPEPIPFSRVEYD